jgi:hypothetical protein
VQRGQTPLVASEYLTGFQYSEYLTVHSLPNRGVTRHLDSIHTVIRVVREWKRHEVGLH